MHQPSWNPRLRLFAILQYRNLDDQVRDEMQEKKRNSEGQRKEFLETKSWLTKTADEKRSRMHCKIAENISPHQKNM
jgi:hypothetical protein